MTTEIVKNEKRELQFDQLEKMAEVMAKGKILGNWDTKEKILTIMLIAHAEGVNPLQAIFRYDPIPNKSGLVMARKKPIAMLNDFIERGGRIKWLVTNSTEAKATFYKSDDENGFTFNYTWQQAVKAGLSGKDNWQKNSEDMLRWQVVGRGLRIYDPASTGLMYTPYEVPDELEDAADAPKVTPVQQIFNVEPADESKNLSAINETKSFPKITVAEEESQQIKFERAMKEFDAAKLNDYLVSIKYLKRGEFALLNITEKRQKYILDNLDKFREKVNAHVISTAQTEVKND